MTHRVRLTHLSHGTAEGAGRQDGTRLRASFTWFSRHLFALASFVSSPWRNGGWNAVLGDTHTSEARLPGMTSVVLLLAFESVIQMGQIILVAVVFILVIKSNNHV